MADNDHFVTEAAVKASSKTDRRTPDLYTGEPPLQSAHNTGLRLEMTCLMRWVQTSTDLGQHAFVCLLQLTVLSP